MNTNYTTDDLLRQKLTDAAGPMPDADALWTDFEPILEAEILNPMLETTVFEPATADGSGAAFSGLAGWVTVLLVGVVLGAGAMFFSKKAADLIENGDEIAAPTAFSENENAATSPLLGSRQEQNEQNLGVKKEAAFSKNAAEMVVGEDANNGQASVGETAATAQKALRSKAQNGKWQTFQAEKGRIYSQKAIAQSPLLASDHQQIQQNFEAKSGVDFAQKVAEKVVGEAPTMTNEPSEKTEKAVEKAKNQPFSPLFQPKIKAAEPSKKADQAAVFSKIRRPALQKIRGRNEVMAFLGSDLERHNPVLNGGQPARDMLNFGLGVRVPIPNSLWHGRAEIWYSQIALPTVSTASTFHFDLDGQRLTIEDTLWMHRMAGVSINFQAERRLFGGFSMLGGLAISHLPWVTSREQHSNAYSAVSGNTFGGDEWIFSELIPTPALLRRWQFGPKIGLEKTFFDHFFIGTTMTQNLIDYTKGSLFKSSLPTTNAESSSNDGYRIQRNWLAYVGYRF